MGFMRQYAEESGDPFRFRIPRGLRKLTPGRALKHAVHGLTGVAGFVPGLGPAMDFARSYGLIQGDPGPKRKQAGAGPKAKAHAKAQHRAQKAAKLHGAAAAAHAAKQGKHKKGKKHGGGGSALSGIGSAVGGFLQPGGGLDTFTHRAAGLVPGVSQGEELLGMDQAPDFGTFSPGAHGGRGVGGHRRHINPANVHALRRSIRRMESFERLVHKVTPHLVARHRSSSHRSSGHKAGCKCVACSARSRAR